MQAIFKFMSVLLKYMTLRELKGSVYQMCVCNL